MKIEILEANIIDEKSPIIFPVCVPDNLSEDEVTYRKEWIKSVISELCNNLEVVKNGRRVVIVIADTLDRYNRDDTPESSKSIEEDGRKWIEYIQGVIGSFDLAGDEKQAFTISSWDDHYRSDKAKKCIELFEEHIYKNENKKIKKYFDAVAENFAEHSNASDKTSALMNIRAYLIEEYGVFLFWRMRYKNPLVIQSFVSDKRMRILQCINHIVTDSSVIHLQGRIQSMSFIDVEKHPELTRVEKNKKSKSNVNPQNLKSSVFPQMSLMWKPFSCNESDMENVCKIADDKLRTILEAGGTSVLADGQREYAICMIMMLQLNASFSTSPVEPITDDPSPSIRAK